MQPLGSGPEVLAGDWPPMPVLIMGMSGSGRRTWAEWVLRQHHVRQVMILRADDGLSVAQARDMRTWLSVRSRDPRWASVDLDATTGKAQNALLKLLEEPPPGARVILRGQRQTVLETIRSRCRVIRLRPATVEAEMDFVEAAAGVSSSEAETAVMQARGRPGHALELASQSEAASRGYGLVQAAMSGDLVAVASGLNDHQADWEQVRSWMLRWAARSNPPRLSAVTAVREIHEPRLAVRTALDRLVRLS